MQNHERFHTSMIKFSEIDECCPYEVEFVLFGLNYQAQECLEEIQRERLHEHYSDIYCDMRSEDLSVTDFITQAKKLISKAKVSELGKSKFEMI